MSMSRILWMGMVLLAAGMAVADETNRTREVKVGIYVLNLGKLDVGSGAFTADFYLSLKSADPIPDASFEFLNGRAASLERMGDARSSTASWPTSTRRLT
jgi:hypothetical protein